jgi:hypothetical protein
VTADNILVAQMERQYTIISQVGEHLVKQSENAMKL